MIKIGLFSVALLVSSSIAQANTVAIDFLTYKPGTAISSLEGVSFSLVGSGPGLKGIPETGQVGNHGLSNSTTGGYSTNNILEVNFDGMLASDVNFNFDNFGYPFGGRGRSFVDLYGTGGLLGSMSLGTHEGSAVDLPYSNISYLLFNNNSNGAYNWIFFIDNLSAKTTPLSAVPLPSSLLLMVSGLGLIAAIKGRISKANKTV